MVRPFRLSVRLPCPSSRAPVHTIASSTTKTRYVESVRPRIDL